MRKLVSTLLLLGFYGVVNAQTETETVNWLKQNQSKLDHVNCQQLNIYGDYFEINDYHVRLYNDLKQECKITWDNVKKVSVDNDFIYVVSKDKLNEENIRLKLFIADQSMRSRFGKAVQHLATIKTNTIAKVEKEVF